MTYYSFTSFAHYSFAQYSFSITMDKQRAY